MKHLAGEARRQAYRSADHLLVVRNWLIGWRIVTQEQNGKERAKYGKHVIKLASQTLTEEFGRGFGLTSIKNMRSFYLMFSKLQIGQALLDQFKLTDEPIRQAPLDESTIPFYPNLSWFHYERLLRVKDADASEQWDYCTLQRNISSQYYYRLLQPPEHQRKEVSDEMRSLTSDFEIDKLSYLMRGWAGA